MSIQFVAGKLKGEERKAIIQGVQKQMQEAALSGERLRPLRALEVLERIGTPEARQVVEGLARAAAGTPLRQEAKAVLERLGVR